MVRRRAAAVRELKTSLDRFDEAVGRFERSYRVRHEKRTFEHPEEVRPRGERDCRPVHFARHGVTANRWNARLDCVDVVGFATQDQTNCARGSRTAGLLQPGKQLEETA